MAARAPLVVGPTGLPQQLQAGDGLLLPGAGAGNATLSFAVLTTARTHTLPDATGTFALTSQIPATDLRVAFVDGTVLSGVAGFEYSKVSGTLSVPSFISTNSITASGYVAAGTLNTANFTITGNTITLTAGTVQFGSAQLAANATTGFIAVPNSAGAPTGTPSGINTGQTPITFAGSSLYAYVSGAWTGVTGAVGPSGAVGATGATGPGLVTVASTSSVTGFAADTYLAGSFKAFPAAPVVGTTYRLMFDVTKTAAGLATPIITIRTGTTGTTARLTFTFGAGTAVVDNGVFTVLVTFRTVGSGTTAVLTGFAQLVNNLTTTGLSNAAKARSVTSAGFDSTTASLGIGCSYNGGASASHTVTLVRAEVQT
jgi:hypothetical protein